MDQDQDIQSTVSGNAVTLCGKSWTAYVGLMVRLLLLIGLGGVALYYQTQYWQIIAIILVMALIFLGYQLLLLRSYRLYYDEAGVWIYSGILPWRRGVAGVKWRDLDEAIFVNSFWSWISRSYSVQLKHRFTKTVEIGEADMAQGKQAVVTINQQLQLRIGREAVATQQPLAAP